MVHVKEGHLREEEGGLRDEGESDKGVHPFCEHQWE